MAKKIQQEVESLTGDLKEIEEVQMKVLYDTAPVGLCVLDNELRFVRINEKLAEINGIPVAEHIGRTVREVVPALADQAEKTCRQIMETGEPVLDIEFRGTTPSHPGVYRTWIEHWLPLKSKKETMIGISVVALEITERKQEQEDLQDDHDELEIRVKERTAELEGMAERLRVLSARLIEVMEEERHNVALELHDGFGGSLLGIKMAVEQQLRDIQKGKSASDSTSLEKILELVKSCMRDSRRLQQNLRPSVLD